MTSIWPKTFCSFTKNGKKLVYCNYLNHYANINLLQLPAKPLIWTTKGSVLIYPIWYVNIIPEHQQGWVSAPGDLLNLGIFYAIINNEHV